MGASQNTLGLVCTGRLAMEGSSKVTICVAVLLCAVSLYFGRQRTTSRVLGSLSGNFLFHGHRTTGALSAIHDASSRLSVLYVMDPSIYSWEYVYIDDFTNDTVVAWMRGLNDALTATAAAPEGSPLMVPLSAWRLPATSYDAEPSTSFDSYIKESLEMEGGYLKLPTNLIMMRQLAMGNVSWDRIHSALGLPSPGVGGETPFTLPLERIRVTSADNFWRSVNATVMMGRPLAAQAGSLTCMGAGSCTDADVASHHLATDLSGTAVILPRAVPKIYGNGRGGYHGLEQMIQSLRSFLQISGTLTVPSLDEYQVLPNKVALYHMYNSYSAEGHTLPIPTAFLPAPANRDWLVNIHHSANSADQAQPTEFLIPGVDPAQLDVVMASIWKTHRHLHGVLSEERKKLGWQHPLFVHSQDSVDGSSGKETMLHYVLKREYSELSAHIKYFKFPLAALLMSSPSTPIYSPTTETRPCIHEFRAHHIPPKQLQLARLALLDVYLRRLSDVVFLSRKTCRRVGNVLERCLACGEEDTRRHIRSWAWCIEAFIKFNPQDKTCNWRQCGSRFNGDAPWRARPSLPEALATVGGRRPLWCDAEGNRTCAVAADLRNLPYLHDVALFVMRQSCGEGFLIQPKLKSMPRSEYRVYLYGGASAQGAANDTVVVYTPIIGGLEWQTVLDEGEFCRTSVTHANPYNGWGPAIGEEELDTPEEATRLYHETHPFPWPDLHRAIVTAALDGAKAIAKYSQGKARTVSSVFARMDVVLLAYRHQGPDDAELGASSGAGDVHFLPMVSEMDWINSGGVHVKSWKTRFPVPAMEGNGTGVLEAAGMYETWGYRLAQLLLEEAVISSIKAQSS